MEKQEKRSLVKCLLMKGICLIKKRKNKKKIAVISLKGIISNSSFGKNGINIDNLKKIIEKAFEVKNLQAVALVINCPGGSPVQTELIYEKIKFLAKKNSIKIFSFVEDVAASGGYWLSLAGEEIYASKSSIIGSIGVIYSSFGLQEMIKKIGIERRIHSSGNNKALFDIFEKENPEHVEILKDLQQDIYEHFTETVIKERGEKIANSSDLFDGTCWSGKKARELGLIDGIGSLEQIMREKFGEEIIFEEMEQEKSWLKKKIGINLAIFLEDFIDKICLKLQHKLIFEKFDQY